MKKKHRPPTHPALINPRVMSMRGKDLGWSLVMLEKLLENRRVGLRGWRWVHISQNDILPENADDVAAQCPWVHALPDCRGYIIGAVHFSHSVDSNDTQLDVSATVTLLFSVLLDILTRFKPYEDWPFSVYRVCRAYNTDCEVECLRFLEVPDEHLDPGFSLP